jgi:pimeloyl-ACP methyl ester carboxylesterase
VKTVRSQDGTRIAFDKEGDGPTLILVDGALTKRASGSKPELTRLLAHHFTVYSYDRRGRGDSEDTKPYALEREIEDIESLIDEAGGSALLSGHSSGGCLALEAAVKLAVKVKKLAIYEAPYNDDPEAQKAWTEYRKNLADALGSDRRGDAAALFMTLVGMPAAQIQGMRQAPFWRGMEELAPTLAYDHGGVMGDDLSVPVGLAARVGVPTLVMSGSNGAPFMRETAKTLAEAIPGAKLSTLEGQTHDVSPAALAPVLAEFFGT